ncbi:MAG: hypothetical protein KTR15_03975 [Phycisphaeraceae bacterium]|nr:hypothetical protein [Phycisphaeraceae bacterium]
MTRHNTLSLASVVALTGCLLCCKAKPSASADETPWHVAATADDSPGQQVTIIIALSSIVPGGIVGHAGLAVEDAYWDFGPKRTELLQPIKSIRSKAGPWWDDPEQQWAVDRSLDEVLADMPDKVHPQGSLVAMIRVQVTDQQAQAITDFWHDTYARMVKGEDTYRLSARQCASMVGWSLRVGLQGDSPPSDRLPRDLHLMTPTRLYESLSESLTHAAGPYKGRPADVTLWQLNHEGLTPWQRPIIAEQLRLPELPRIRLAVERIKHLPADLLHE